MTLRDEVAARMALALGAEVLTPREAAGRASASLRALVVVGTPTPAEWVLVEAALLPGALVALLADDPLGTEAATGAEESGLAVWDAILVADDPDSILPAPKPSRAEKEAGLGGVVAPRAGHEAVKRKEGSAGVRNARAGAGRTARSVLNDHPTVKPVAAVRAAMRTAGVYDEGADGPVLDLFSGSGTTGIACVQDGIPVVLVDKKRAYAELSAARVRGSSLVRDLDVQVVDRGIADPLGENPEQGAPQVPLVSGGTAPVQIMYSNAHHGPAGPQAGLCELAAPRVSVPVLAPPPPSEPIVVSPDAFWTAVAQAEESAPEEHAVEAPPAEAHAVEEGRGATELVASGSSAGTNEGTNEISRTAESVSCDSLSSATETCEQTTLDDLPHSEQGSGLTMQPMLIEPDSEESVLSGDV